MKTIVAFAVAAMLTAAASGAEAATFQNGSFETGQFTDNTGQGTMSLAVGSTVITGWTVTGGGTTAWEGQPNPFTITPSDGSFNLDLTGYTDYPPFGGVSQQFDTVAGHVYALTYDVGNSGRYNNALGASVAAFIDGASIYEFNNATLDATDPAHSTWLTGRTTFTAAGASTLLELRGTLGGAFIGLDNVTVTDVTGNAGAVPEPATWAMMLLGFGGLGVAMRRRNTGARIRFA